MRTLTAAGFASTVSAQGIVLVDVRSSRSGSSRAFSAVLDAVAARHPDVTFAAVDADAEVALAAELGVRSAPTLMVYRDGVLVFAEPGWLPEDSVDLLIATVRVLDMPAVVAQYPEPL
ncbi:thioredoxin [Geodermatophilus normandii]|uniref:Thioredoxin n=1 Tax=Geodermatophilus normandii TaxID=1137989 RepID=A0A317QTG5_9ACTN|nr:thioredoxin family protein [Geodermatophilus normandii]PWW25030.1 thioredoxin [Geodermatophilus normandii]